MKIAVTSLNFQTVTGNAGRARRFLIYDVPPGANPVESGRLDLAPEQCFEAFISGAHPLDGVDVVLSQGFGPRFVRMMSQRAIQVAGTHKEDPVEAVREYLVRRAAGAVQPVVGDDCDCDHAPACDSRGQTAPALAAAG
jgi:predicted Fe-Mo cluster-binding NifX family protein